MWGSCTKYIVDLVVMLQFYLLCRRIEKSQGQGFDGGGQAVPCLFHPLLLGNDLLVVNLGLELIKKKVIEPKLCQTKF